MRHTLAPVVLLTLFVACGGSNSAGNDPFELDSGGGSDGPNVLGDGGQTGDSNVPPGYDANPGTDGSTSTDGGGGTTCTSLKCTSDSECQSACGTVSGGIYCCDTATQVCFPTSASECPVSTPPSDGGTMY
jgi:hypothetical protein